MESGGGMYPAPGQWPMNQMPQAMQQPEAVEAPEMEEGDNSHRPPNAFILYSQAMRTQVRQENPSLSNTEVSRLLGKMWKEVPNEIKLQYKQKAAAMQEEFKREHPDYTYRKARRKRALNELLTKSSTGFSGFPMGGAPFAMPGATGDMSAQPFPMGGAGSTPGFPGMFPPQGQTPGQQPNASAAAPGGAQAGQQQGAHANEPATQPTNMYGQMGNMSMGGLGMGMPGMGLGGMNQPLGGMPGMGMQGNPMFPMNFQSQAK